jgi:hypothetical protein
MRAPPYVAYCMFLALKNHFSKESYDYFKYRGKTNVSMESFMARKDRILFQKLCRKVDEENLEDYIVATLKDNPGIWISDLLESEAMERYENLKKSRVTFSDYFASELDLLVKTAGSLKEAFTIKGNQYPEVINLRLCNTLSLETFCVLEALVGFSTIIDKKIGADDILWSKMRLQIKKFTPFLKYDRKSAIAILKDKMENE